MTVTYLMTGPPSRKLSNKNNSYKRSSAHPPTQPLVLHVCIGIVDIGIVLFFLFSHPIICVFCLLNSTAGVGVGAGHREHYPARYQGGRLNYRGEFYSCGHHIIIDNKEDSPVQLVLSYHHCDFHRLIYS